MLSREVTSRLKGGVLDHCLPTWIALANEAVECAATTATATFEFVDADDKFGDDEFVPELILRVRRADTLPED